jgi:hypothetical protein
MADENIKRGCIWAATKSDPHFLKSPIKKLFDKLYEVQQGQELIYYNSVLNMYGSSTQFKTVPNATAIRIYDFKIKGMKNKAEYIISLSEEKGLALHFDYNSTTLKDIIVILKMHIKVLTDMKKLLPDMKKFGRYMETTTGLLHWTNLQKIYKQTLILAKKEGKKCTELAVGLMTSKDATWMDCCQALK